MSTQQALFNTESEALMAKLVNKAASQEVQYKTTEPDDEPVSLGDQMNQLLLDFEASPSIMDALNAEAPSEAPGLYEVDLPQEKSSPDDYSIVNSAYIELAIDLMLTCAEDLISAQKVLDSDRSQITTRAFNRANKTIAHTTAWLMNDVSALGKDKDGHDLVFRFTFRDCAELLEEELRIQSLDQIAIPRIVDRADELALWIIDDPAQAKYVFTNYKKIFSGRDDVYVETEDEDFMEDSTITTRQRYSA